jgi:AraC-like DNA-binding protein
VPYHLKPEVVHYFHHVPFISFRQNWEGLLITFAGYLRNEETKFQIIYRKFDPGDPSAEYNPKQDASLSLQLIKNLYKDEDTFLDAIKAGDTKRALQCIADIGHYRPPQRAPQEMRNGKNYLLVLNTLLRKTVQDSSVHPIHIHTVSNDFAQQIEAVDRMEELISISETMIRRYCSLVQEYSLRKYSLAVRNVITTVEFNLKEPLSLSILARQFSIDPSNLSHQFTRETGMTLTTFINKKRLEYAKHLLAGSALYIQEIAEECGFQDINYFCRLFKQKYGITPNKYRHSLHSGIL